MLHQAPPASATAPKVLDIGAISPFGNASVGWDVNNLGTVVGFGRAASSGANPDRGFRYNAADGFEDIGDLPGATDTTAYGVNDSDVITGDSGSQAFRWTRAGGMEGLGVLPGFESSQARAINNAGMIVGVSRRLVADAEGPWYYETRGFTWTEDAGMQQIPTPEGFSVWVTDVNNHGEVIGFINPNVSDPSMIEHGFRWSATKGLTLLEFSRRVQPMAINDAGVIVGNMYKQISTGSEQGAFRWTDADGVQYLGGLGLERGTNNAFATGVSDDGTIIGYENGVDGSYRPTPFKWTEGNGIQPIDMPSAVPQRMSSNGTIVGNLWDTTVTVNKNRAFMILPAPMDGEFLRVDGEAATVRKGETTQVNLRVDNTSKDSLSALQVVSASVEPVGAAGGDGQLRATSGLDRAALDAGESALAGFDLKGLEAGPMRLVANVQAVGPKGLVTAEISTNFTVDGDDLSVEVTLDPPIVHSADRVPGEPASVGITVKVTNGADDDVTNVTLQDLNVSRVFAGQQLLFDFVDPGPVGPGEIKITERPGAIDPVSLPDVPAHDSITLRARIEIETPGAFEVSAMVWGRGYAPTTLVAVGKAALTIESGLTVELDGANGPTANLVDVIATIKNSSGSKITGLDWGDGLGLEVLAGSSTLEQRSGPTSPLPTSLDDGQEVKIRWRFEVWDVGVAVSTLKATGHTELGIDVEAIGELSSKVSANDLTAADMQRSAQLAFSSAIDQVTEVGEGIEAQGANPPTKPGDKLRQARYASYLNEGFSDAQAKILADVSVSRDARERYLVAFADGMNRRAGELGDKFVADAKDIYGLLSDAQRRNAAGAYMIGAMKENAGYLGDAFATPNAEKARNLWNLLSRGASNGATAIQQAAIGQAELWRISDQQYLDDPMGWATSNGQRRGALMSDFNAAFTTELLTTVTGEAGAAGLRAAKRELGAGVTALRASTVAESGAAATVRSGGDDALGAATRQFADAEAKIKRFQELEYGQVLSRSELENIGGFSANDAGAIDAIIANVKAKYGVDIDMVARTAEPLSNDVVNGIGKRSYTKEKAVGELDKLLGAPDQLGGRVTIFEPKPISRAQLEVLEAREPGFTVRYQDRLKTQQKNWDMLQSGNSKTGRLVEASQKHDGITIVSDLPGNPTHGVEYLEQLSDPSYVSSRGWTPDYADTLRTQLEHHPSRVRAKLGFEEVDGAFSVVDTIDGTVHPIVSDYDLQAVIPTNGAWPAGKRGQIETYVKSEMDRLGRSGRHGWSAAANDLPSMNFDLAAEFIMNTAHPSVARQTAENLAGRFKLLANEFRAKAARLAADDPARAQLLAKAGDFDQLTADKILEKWKPGEKTIVFSKGRVTVGSGEGTVP